MDNVFLPRQDREYLSDKKIEYRETTDGIKKALIIDNFQLPGDKFNDGKASLMIYMPEGYPDVPPDMFYFCPPLILKQSNRQPAFADQAVNYLGLVWQQWSRHAPAGEWRSGIDGIHSYIQRVLEALRTAA